MPQEHLGRGQEGKEAKGLCDEASGMEPSQRFIRGLQGPPLPLSYRSRVQTIAQRTSGSSPPLSSSYTWLISLGKGDLKIPGSKCLQEAPKAPQLLFDLNRQRQKVERLYPPLPVPQAPPVPSLLQMTTVGK